VYNVIPFLGNTRPFTLSASNERPKPKFQGREFILYTLPQKILVHFMEVRIPCNSQHERDFRSFANFGSLDGCSEEWYRISLGGKVIFQIWYKYGVGER